ncbi:Macrolide export ATP-binding/permease protein MacB [Devosia equisanguinis]|uniref:Macrolide export ATP-binding/permease protein MacB n=1 Tax=Devosia equisanguinis TaxID=2490941 RepID=A0A3S4GI00_9HYPH|nr:ABC transporter permease [Devosia equisanguinis]VDS04992.1 Macrolide export ATP-binding/permease protein MacB [Devosia equisanguinis]
MIYGFKIAWRYLTSNKAQTGLLIAGVAVGVFVFIFMSALIGGLASYLVQRTVGDISHVTIEAPSREAGLLLPEADALLVQQRASGQRETLRTAEAFLPSIEAMAGVKAVSPQIVGNGFVIRGHSRAPVGVTGVEADKVSAIADLGKRIVAGDTVLTNSTVIIGKTLADDLGIGVGQVIRLQSDRNVERPLVVTGIFSIGLDALDARAAFVSTATARTLFELPQGLSRVEIKLDDLNRAAEFARRIAADTGLKATPWTEGNAQLLDGLRAQASSGNLIKAFALITIVIGVASALLLSTYRRRPEIGIMRAFGASRGFVVLVFVVQGALIGILGGLIGAGLGYLALSPFPVPENAQPGGLPVDVRQGAYGLAIALTAIGAILASILPARAAARVDPVSVIGQ